MDQLTADYLAEQLRAPGKPSTPGDPRFVAGLDLGQLSDYSALAVDEVTEELKNGKVVRSHHIRALKRWPLRTPYGDVVGDVVKAFARPPLTGGDLVVDRTGVGVAVCETLVKARPQARRIVRVGIHGGEQTSHGPGGWGVPKRELAGVLQVLLGHGRLHFAEGLPEAKTLKRELEQFRVKINLATGHDSFEAWRERDHDDLVLAVALAAWWGQRELRRFSVGL